MKTILFICPYFGKLPIAHMKLWLLSCEKNPTINWLILTDDYTEELKYPSNVKVVYTTLEAIKQQVQRCLTFLYILTIHINYVTINRPMVIYSLNTPKVMTIGDTVT